MADGGQRLLDVIDDPNALESFLGGLTTDTELLPSAETVDTASIVASLARSLGEHEYEVDSPNETLFDTLDSSSNHLTDISRSYVPSDFGHVAVQNDAFTNNLDGFSNGSNNVIRGNPQQHQHHHEQQTQQGVGVVETSGCDQFIGTSNASTNNLINSTLSSGVISATSSAVNNNSTTVTANSTLKQISASVSNCDPSKTLNNFVQTGQLNSIIVSSAPPNSLNYSTFSQDLHQHQQQQQHNKQQHEQVVSVSQNQLNQVTSLSSIPVEGQIQQNSGPSSNSTNSLISAVIDSSNTNNENGGNVSTLTTGSSASTSFQQQQQTGQSKAQNTSTVVPNSNIQATITQTVSSGGLNNVANVNASTAPSNNASLSTTTNVVGSVNNITAATIQQTQQQFLTNTSSHQLVSGQTVSIPNLTVSAPQLIANSQGGLVAASAAGQNIIQQLQTASAGQSYIAMEQPTALIGTTAFGAANVALVATGGTPTYAVLPTTPQFLTNAIIPQTHAIQTLTKAAAGTYFQTTGTPQLVATSTALQNVSAASTVTSSSAQTPPVTSVSSTTENASSNLGQSGAQQTVTQTTSSAPSTTVTDGVVTQLIQQTQQQLTNVSGSTGTVAITPQQSFAIGSAAGLGQVVVSQVSNLSTMTTPQQTQLTGTIVMNQYGQQLLLPTASTAQAGLQLILRQQPAQPQVLTIQAPTSAAALSAQATAQAGGKPIVRYISQVPQVAQTQGYGLQQIQTPNGPTLVAFRYPQVSQASQFSQISADSIVTPSQTIQSQIATTGQSQQIQLQTQQIQLQQQQAQQLLQQTHQQQQQSQQIQLQASQLQTHQQVQVQGTAQLQTLQTQQQHQITLQTQNQQQGQLAASQQQVQQQQQGYQQSLQPQSFSQTSAPIETQSTSTGLAQQHIQYNANRTNQQQVSGFNQSTNQSQTQAQFVRDSEQQQVSVPDSSSEPPPPKKAKSKAKNSKKKEKVTLDLEQLLKQSGIMDEDLNDDMMSFDFGFGSSMDVQTNGLPPSPQVPPAQIPVINTTETPKKSTAKKSKSNAKSKAPAQTQPPPPPIHPPVASPILIGTPSAKTPKKKAPSKKKNNQATIVPPPPTPTLSPQLPPPPPIVTTPTSSKSKSSKKKKDLLSPGSSGSVNENQKSETKTASSKKTAPPKKMSSLDTLLETINAVAAAAGASSSPLRKTPSPTTCLPPPPPPITTTPTSSRSKPSPSPKNKEKKSKSKKSKTAAADSNLPAKPDSFSSSLSNSPSIVVPPPPISPNLSQQSSPQVSTSNFVFSQPQTVSPGVSLATPMSQTNNNINYSSMVSAPSISSVTQQQQQMSPRTTGPNNLTNGNSSSVPTSHAGLSGLTRVVQTIQLTPQNQQLLRNIQSQIQRLLALPKRSETEQTALQKLVVLQQQVIATGKPVAIPAHLNNLAQSVNVEAISVATPSGSVPSSDFATASSSFANAPLISPSTSCEFDVSPSPVSSTVVTTAAVNPNTIININSSSKTVKIHNSNTSVKQLPQTSSLSSSNASNSTHNNNISASGGGTANSSNSIVVGSPSVSSTASPDSTSLNFDQCYAPSSSSSNSNSFVVITAAHQQYHPQNATTTNTNTSTSNAGSNFSCGGVGNVVVSKVKTELGQLVASKSVAPSSEDKHLKENTHGKGAQGVATSTSVPITTTSSSSVSFSQHLQHVPPNSSYLSSTFPPSRPPVDEKKAEEQRMANLKAEEEKRARWKKEEFDMLLQRDQQYVVKPDYEVPFASNKDAVERLMKYHIYKDRNDMNFEQFDAEFSDSAVILQERFSVMLSKYRNLLLKESTKEVSCAERVMLERMFVGEEKNRLEQDRLSVARGDVMDMPPPPESWVPTIKEMVDKEMMEFEPQDPIVSQQVQSAIDSIIGCEADDVNAYVLEEGEKIEYDAFGVPINNSGYAGLGAASSADIDEAVRSILT